MSHERIGILAFICLDTELGLVCEIGWCQAVLGFDEVERYLWRRGASRLKAVDSKSVIVEVKVRHREALLWNRGHPVSGALPFEQSAVNLAFHCCFPVYSKKAVELERQELAVGHGWSDTYICSEEMYTSR